jgi:hypothetical protein
VPAEHLWAEKDSVRVSFILVADWFSTVTAHSQLNANVTRALEASLCAEEEEEGGGEGGDGVQGGAGGPAAAGERLSPMLRRMLETAGVTGNWEAILRAASSGQEDDDNEEEEVEVDQGEDAPSSFLLGLRTAAAAPLCSDSDGDGLCDCDGLPPDLAPDVTEPPFLPGCDSADWAECYPLWLILFGTLLAVAATLVALAYWHHAVKNSNVLIYASEPVGNRYDVMLRPGAAIFADGSSSGGGGRFGLVDMDDDDVGEVDLDTAVSLQELANAAPGTQDLIAELSDMIDSADSQ